MVIVRITSLRNVTVTLVEAAMVCFKIIRILLVTPNVVYNVVNAGDVLQDVSIPIIMLLFANLLRN